ncbi:M48 family metalloprotease [Roseomonas stagni]|uniref:M48 family metalloprotease n=1 Tax=Falsiroseomonas algicola TaxID=2716930 RepID=A0A6M1LQC8_9PROT|nr:M48 family metalloprotease [Falsiroseomonas algicola]NGM22615.1 M48 family metalloprotease [Falsiroseomonas algicola]
MQATGLRTHGWNTALRSILLLAGFPFLLVAMGYALALFLVAWDAPSVAKGFAQAWRLLPTIIPLALVVAGLWFLIAWRANLRILEIASGAKRVQDPRDEPRLWRLAEELCIARGMRLPRLSVIESPARNAFAAGLTPDRSMVAVTRGLMDALDDRELSAVLAHELAHIRNGDARLGVIATVFCGVITLVTDGVWNILKAMRHVRLGRGGSSNSSSSSNRSSGNSGGAGVVVVLILVAIVIAVMAHVLAIVLRMALSRNREYLADAGAVEMTQDADAMISALRKVAQRPQLPDVAEQVRALFLHDRALSRNVGWFATHPPIERRIEALVRYAGGHDPGPLPEIEDETPEAEAEAGDPDATMAPWKPEHAPAFAGGGEASPWAPAASAALPPRSDQQERLDAMAAFARTLDPQIMKNQAKREEARRDGRNPDEAAPPPPRG